MTTATDRQGQEIHLGDLVRFELFNEPNTTMKVVHITPPTHGHATLTLTGGFQIDSLSVERVEPPIQSETSKYLEQMAKAPPKQEHQGRRSQTPTARRERDHPAPTQPKRAPTTSNNKTVKTTKKGTHS